MYVVSHFSYVTRLTQKALEMKIKCVPLIFSSLVIEKWNGKDQTQFPKLCHNLNRPAENQLLRLFYQVHSLCKRLCVSMNYEANVELSDEDGVPTNAIGLTYWFPTNELEVRKQYLIYDFYGLIGFIGGTLGLFIGFSFYDSITDFFYFLKNLLSLIVEKIKSN